MVNMFASSKSFFSIKSLDRASSFRRTGQGHIAPWICWEKNAWNNQATALRGLIYSVAELPYSPHEITPVVCRLIPLFFHHPTNYIPYSLCP